jgi:hypothetical protein
MAMNRMVSKQTNAATSRFTPGFAKTKETCATQNK